MNKIHLTYLHCFPLRLKHCQCKFLGHWAFVQMYIATDELVPVILWCFQIIEVPRKDADYFSLLSFRATLCSACLVRGRLRSLSLRMYFISVLPFI